ncbi:MAG: response regulator [Fimbriimonas sp.]
MSHPPFTILLIEDDRDDEQLALRALRGCGLSLVVRVARDGERALHALGLDGSPEGLAMEAPDLVISDLKMPKLNGDEVLRLARADERLKSVPYVVFSSSDEPNGIERCHSYGVSEYTTKPVDFELYIQRVRGIAQRWLGETSPERSDNVATQVR